MAVAISFVDALLRSLNYTVFMSVFSPWTPEKPLTHIRVKLSLPSGPSLVSLVVFFCACAVLSTSISPHTKNVLVHLFSWSYNTMHLLRQVLYFDVLTPWFPASSPGNGLIMKRSGTAVIGNKDGANAGNGDPVLEKNASSLSWRGKAWCYVSWGLAVPLGEHVHAFPINWRGSEVILFPEPSQDLTGITPNHTTSL